MLNTVNVQIQTQCITSYRRGCGQMSQEPHGSSAQLYLPAILKKRKEICERCVKVQYLEALLVVFIYFKLKIIWQVRLRLLEHNKH